MTVLVQHAPFFEYAKRHGFALFPIPAGQKDPYRPAHIVQSWKKDFSADPAQWAAWAVANPNCNFGVVGYASKLIIVDIDVKEVGRDRAYALWAKWCHDHGLDYSEYPPHVQSCSQGWHIMFRIPDEVDASALTQRMLVGPSDGGTKAVVETRINGFVVAAGSYYDGHRGGSAGYYQFMSDAAPYPAPEVLVKKFERATIKRRVTVPGQVRQPEHAKADIVRQIEWVQQFGDESHPSHPFAGYDNWIRTGFAFKSGFGADGFDLWEMTFDSRVDYDKAVREFNKADEDGATTLRTWFGYISDLGCPIIAQKTAAGMFAGVTGTGATIAQLAADTGASLSSGAPLPPPTNGAMPMLAGQEALTNRCTPILKTFLASTSDAPARPIANDPPALPTAMDGHGLYALLNESISRTIAMAEGKKWKPGSIKGAMAVLLLAHQDVFESVRRQVESMGRTFPLGPIKTEAKGIEDDVQRTFLKEGDWIYDPKNLPEADNPDNLKVFLQIIGAEVRWNAWFNRSEIQGFEWPTWTPMHDVILSKLKRRALRTGTRFRVSSEFLKEQLLALAHDNVQDPVLDRINSLVWDGTPRLAIWLTAACGVPCDPYHQSVGKNVIGGIVKRARVPGAKHDEVMILMGPQGCGKSNLTKVLALQPEYHTDSVTFDGTPQNVIPQLFGKLVVELAELDGMARKEVQSIKRFISTESDNFTAKYEAFSTERPRRCVFVGTSNESNPLVDVTGNRRFLPVKVSRVNIAWLRENIEQLFAEAAALQSNGATFSIPENVWDAAKTHQESARSVSDIEVRLCDWFGETPHTATAFITVPDLAELCDFAGWRNMHSFRNHILRGLGFREEKPYIDGKRTNVFVRGPTMLPKHIAGLTRYLVSKTQDGRPRVIVRTHEVASSATANALGLPPPPPPLR